MNVTKVAILTAQKCSGKTYIADQLRGELGCDLLLPDKCIKRPLFDQFGNFGTIERTVDAWQAQGKTPQVCQRVRELLRGALTESKAPVVLTEWWCYHMRKYRQALYQAVQDLELPSVRLCLVEFTLPLPTAIERILNAHSERSLSQNWARRSPQQQQQAMQRRQADWERRLQLPDEAEQRQLADWRRFESSDDAATYLTDWLG